MAEVKIAIYKTPAQAAKIGLTFPDTRSFTKAEAIKLRDYYKDLEAGRVTTTGFISLCSPLIGVKLGASVATFIGTLAGANGLMKSYLEKVGSSVGKLVDTMADKQKVTFSYKYKQSGSNDGAYWLVSVK